MDIDETESRPWRKKSKWVYLYVSYPSSFSAFIYYKSYICILYSLQFPCNCSESWTDTMQADLEKL